MKPILPPRHFVAVDRDRHKLELWTRPRLRSGYQREVTYPVAVGMVGRETPRGLYFVDDRDLHPTWTMGYYDWVPKELQGKTLAFDDPNNPLKGRWLGLKKGAGVGIHGTADDASIGKDASHGCIRMHVKDIKELYRNVPMGTPVYIA